MQHMLPVLQLLELQVPAVIAASKRVQLMFAMIIVWYNCCWKACVILRDLCVRALLLDY